MRLTTWKRYRIEPYAGPVTWSRWEEAYTLTTDDSPGQIRTHLNPIRQFLTIPEGVSPAPRHRGQAYDKAPYNRRPGYFTNS